jgi:hypothetical protein
VAHAAKLRPAERAEVTCKIARQRGPYAPRKGKSVSPVVSLVLGWRHASTSDRLAFVQEVGVADVWDTLAIAIS